MAAADADLGEEQRKFTRVTCNIPVMFQLRQDGAQEADTKSSITTGLRTPSAGVMQSRAASASSGYFVPFAPRTPLRRQEPVPEKNIRTRRAYGDVWFMASALDLSAAGMKLRFNPSQLGRTLTGADIEWRDARFRFGAGADKFMLDGHFLMVYGRAKGAFITGVEFDAPTPQEQFKIVALYAEYRKMMRI